MDANEQKKIIDKNYNDFKVRLFNMVKLPGTAAANFDCELCKCNTRMDAFTCFMYPDLSLKALCNPCGAKEFVRLDYGNKN